MSKEHLRPDTVHETVGYSHVVKVTGGTTLYLAGQVAWDMDRNILGKGDYTAQMRQALENMKGVVEAAGGTMDDIVKITLYTVNYSTDVRAAIMNTLWEYLNTEKPPVTTLVGVAALAQPDLLIDLDAIAVID
ncbi:MAG: RidA family protein [Chloroflexi bacterium]|nr:RidA family protein [Chloroflexota bacterium]